MPPSGINELLLEIPVPSRLCSERTVLARFAGFVIRLFLRQPRRATIFLGTGENVECQFGRSVSRARSNSS